jgi:hypothetical protein
MGWTVDIVRKESALFKTNCAKVGSNEETQEIIFQQLLTRAEQPGIRLKTQIPGCTYDS